jgi:Domain of unknown function (DUF4190)
MSEPQSPDTVLAQGPPGAPPRPPTDDRYGQPVPRQTTNGFAVAALVLGIVWLYGIGSILALVFGYKARRQIDDSNGAQGGRGMAVAGIVLGWIGMVVPILAILAAVVVFAVGGSTDKQQTNACFAERSALETAVEAYRASVGSYPDSITDVTVGPNRFLRSTPSWYTLQPGGVLTYANDGATKCVDAAP